MRSTLALAFRGWSEHHLGVTRLQGSSHSACDDAEGQDYRSYCFSGEATVRSACAQDNKSHHQNGYSAREHSASHLVRFTSTTFRLVRGSIRQPVYSLPGRPSQPFTQHVPWPWILVRNVISPGRLLLQERISPIPFGNGRSPILRHPRSESTGASKTVPVLGQPCIHDLSWCIGLPAATSAASMMASGRVGWGWMVSARSSTVAPISIASATSLIRFDASGPTIWAPRT